MKRTYSATKSSLTLWTAASVKTTSAPKVVTTFSGWMKKILPTRAETSLTLINPADIADPSPPKKKAKKTTPATPKPTLRIYKIGLRPSPAQRKTLNACIVAANFAYNQCVHLVQHKVCKPHLYDLQKIVAKMKTPEDINHRYAPDRDGWFWKSSTIVRLLATKDFCAAYKAIVSNKKKDVAVIKYKTYDDPEAINPLSGLFGCQKQYATVTQAGLRLLPRLFGKDPIPLVKKKPKVATIDHDFKIEKTSKGKFVLCLTVECSLLRRVKPPAPLFEDGYIHACGIDPGVRSFVTVYDPTRQDCYQFGTSAQKAERLDPITNAIDNWNSFVDQHRDKAPPTAIESWSRKTKKLWYKLKNQVRSLHDQVIAHLLGAYNFISLGKLDVSCFRRGTTAKSTNRWLRIYRHFEFRTKLLARVEGTDNCRVEITDERWTSKTCGMCRSIHRELGAKELFECPNCHYTCHRDVHGARNILLRSFGQFPV
ncbi:hypothetical protein BaRGS_00008620 [Batillaria attramentaria]|uniref:Cas12f1-like TNB domain-containing protein n=1 Tax=Batillaria attramentaria TaxID=370345 RepID=A0ABD0LM48_9CAEN|nr:hypothetical protein BaRGS_009333 [Batillaria attramentaria]